MTTINYSNASVTIRDDVTASHSQVIDHLTSPGTWWAASERRAIAEEARAACLPAVRRP